MNKIAATFASLVFVALIAVGASCGSDDNGSGGGKCAPSETQACDATFNTCVTNAAVTANVAACTQCAKNLCKCYNDCGDSCNENDHTGVCGD